MCPVSVGSSATMSGLLLLVTANADPTRTLEAATSVTATVPIPRIRPWSLEPTWWTLERAARTCQVRPFRSADVQGHRGRQAPQLPDVHHGVLERVGAREAAVGRVLHGLRQPGLADQRQLAVRRLLGD